MEKLVCHGEKFGKRSITSIERHNERENINYSNKEIDTEKTKFNYNLYKISNNDYYSSIMEKVNHRYNPQNRTLRKDAILLCEFVISSSHKFFEDLNEEDTKKFFSKATEFLIDFFGKENTIYATVHVDEHTPHLHFGFIPMTKDNRLCAKEIMTRNSLKDLQNRFPLFLAKNGFQIERGIEKSNVKHLEPNEYKVEMERQKIELTKELNTLKEQKVNVSKIQNITKKKIPFTDNVLVKENELAEISLLAKKNIISERNEEKLLIENQNMKKEIREKIKKIQSLEKELYNYKSIHKQLSLAKSKSEIEGYKKEIKELKGFISKYHIENEYLTINKKEKDISKIL